MMQQHMPSTRVASFANIVMVMYNIIFQKGDTLSIYITEWRWCVHCIALLI